MILRFPRSVHFQHGRMPLEEIQIEGLGHKEKSVIPEASDLTATRRANGSRRLGH